MPKIQKKSEILDKLHDLITKQSEAQTGISGAVLSDTNPKSVSDETETTDKNAVGADKLNGEQGYKQEKAEHEPTDGAKTASAAPNVDLDKLGADLMTMIQNQINVKAAELAQTNVNGKPGGDVVSESVSEKTENVDKNAVGADKLNPEQGFEQKKTDDKSAPVATAKKAEEIEKEAAEKASYQLGQQFCEMLLKKTAEFKSVQEKRAEADLVKEAGRRDFDMLISQAAAELEYQQNNEAEQEKRAEAEGSLAFDNLYKQAQFDAVIEENRKLQSKLAEYDAHVRKVAAEREQEARVQHETELATKVASMVMEALKRESVAQPTK